MSSMRNGVLVFAVGLVAVVTACSSDNTEPTVGNPADAAPDTAPAVPAEAGGGTKKLGETCTGDGDCVSNVCFIGGMVSYCSFKCTTANQAMVCVAPLLPECNTKGYCKKI
jgi:hypothetical protein